MNVYKRKNSQHLWVRFQLAGQQIRRSTGKRTKRDALAWGRKLRDELVASGSQELGALRDCRDLDIRRCAVAGMESRTTTLHTQWGHLCRLLGGTTPCHRLPGVRLQDYVLSRRAEGVSTSTIRRELQTLKRGLELGRDAGWLVLVPRMPALGKHVVGSARTGRLHPIEVLQRWLHELSGEPQVLAVMALNTGLRRHELMRFRMSWLESTGEGSEMVLRLPGEAAKTRGERVVSVASVTLELLLGWAQQRFASVGGDALSSDAPVFSGRDPRAAWDAARAAIGYEPRISFRDLRTTFSSVAMERTGDAAAVQAAMGHSDLRVTQLYQRATVERQLAASRAVGGLLAPPSPSPEEAACHASTVVPATLTPVTCASRTDASSVLAMPVSPSPTDVG